MTDRLGNCRILAEIGSGGMAVVYRAVQEPLGREVAIKSLKPSIAADSGFAKRFEREARFMASFQHENILNVYDLVKDRGTMHIVMEYVQGIDLHELLERATRLPVDVAALIALRVARALDYAHFRGVIHRDVKPANIMVSKNGEVKLMDFGIARDERQSDPIEGGSGLGTPSYMSPEQILGDKLDFRSDVFSLGIVLYQMTTGRKPFVEEGSRTVMQKIRLDRYELPSKLNPAVPRALERIMARCMEKLPAHRYPTTQALIDDLMDFVSAHVPINHNARLVMYLRELGVVSSDEADEILASSIPNRARRGAGDRALLRSVWLMNALLFVVILGTGAAIQGSADPALGGVDPTSAEAAAPVLPEHAGYVRFVVEPWAEVHVDGQHVLTTPSARALALRPGRHYLRLVHPSLPELAREIEVREGRTELIEVALAEAAEGATGSSVDGEAAGSSALAGPAREPAPASERAREGASEGSPTPSVLAEPEESP
jgi:serine/threonine-protein kinase